MKKAFFFLLFTNILFIVSLAQPHYYYQPYDPCHNCDTIPAFDRRYHYTGWYDTCSQYLNGTTFELRNPVEPGSLFLWGKTGYTDRRMAVKGLMCMISRNADGERFLDTIKMPEFLYLYQVGPNDTMIFIDSVRWDTAAPHAMKIPLRIDSTVIDHCLVYDAYFKSPVYVDSTFFIIGSQNSNNFRGPTESNPHNVYSWYYPTHYISPEHPNSQCIDHRVKAREAMIEDDGSLHWWPWNWGYIFGYYMPIVDNRYLNVYSDSLDLGDVGGGGLYPDMSIDTIMAYPKPGCRFLHWNDGNTDNPRLILLTQDTSFTAFFAENQRREVQLYSNNPAWGSVDGDGLYPEGSIVTITATPTSDHYLFEQWSDGDWHNPRTFTLTQDTSFTAIFGTQQGIDVVKGDTPFKVWLSPNPARDRLLVTTDVEDTYSYEIYSKGGQRMTDHQFHGTEIDIVIGYLPTGHYLLKLHSARGTVIKGFVKK